MKAQELRIGNYVNFNNRLQEGQEAVIKSCDFAVIEKQPDWVNPTPLTKGWLLRLGFYWNGRAYKHNKKEYEYDLYSKELTIWNSITLKVKHVHQLQNLYFTLTGKELAIVK